MPHINFGYSSCVVRECGACLIILPRRNALHLTIAKIDVNALQIAVRAPNNQLREGRTIFFIDREPDSRMSGTHSHTNCHAAKSYGPSKCIIGVINVPSLLAARPVKAGEPTRSIRVVNKFRQRLKTP